MALSNLLVNLQFQAQFNTEKIVFVSKLIGIHSCSKGRLNVIFNPIFIPTNERTAEYSAMKHRLVSTLRGVTGISSEC